MKALLILVFVFAMAVNSYTQTEALHSKWSLGTSVTYPLVNIYLVHINYRIDEKHEVFFGPCFQNLKHESFAVNAYTLILGYRYFLWKGLHLEAEIYPAYNNLFSNVTQSYYPGVEMWGELKFGYQFNF